MVLSNRTFCGDEGVVVTSYMHLLSLEIRMNVIDELPFSFNFTFK